MKKIILLLCLVMFMCVNAKHYKKYDKNPNATVLIKLNYPNENDNRANYGNSGITSVDDVLFHKWAIIHTSYFDSVKIEPGIHKVTVSHSRNGKYGKASISHNFEDGHILLMFTLINHLSKLSFRITKRQNSLFFSCLFYFHIF